MSGATVDLGNIKFNWKGPWANSTAYVVNDCVFSSPHGYVCITANTSHASDPLLATSDSAYWNQMTAGSTTGLPTQTGQAGEFLQTDGTTATWEPVTPPTATAVSDQANTSTGYFDLPVGTDAQRPGSPGTGMLRYNSDKTELEHYAVGSWIGFAGSSPTMTSISPTTSIAAGTSIAITGTNFQSGATVTLIGTDSTNYNAQSVTLDSPTQITFTTPELPVSKEPYDIKVTLLNGGNATLDNILDAGGVPAWTTAAGLLGTIVDNVDATHFTLAATDPDSQVVTFSMDTANTTILTSAGLALNGTTGAITGDPTDQTTETTYNFDVIATDSTGVNTTSRSFSITVTKAWGSSSANAGTLAQIEAAAFGGLAEGVQGDLWVKYSGVFSGAGFKVPCMRENNKLFGLACAFNRNANNDSNFSGRRHFEWFYNPNALSPSGWHKDNYYKDGGANPSDYTPYNPILENQDRKTPLYDVASETIRVYAHDDNNGGLGLDAASGSAHISLAGLWSTGKSIGGIMDDHGNFGDPNHSQGNGARHVGSKIAGGTYTGTIMNAWYVGCTDTESNTQSSADFAMMVFASATGLEAILSSGTWETHTGGCFAIGGKRADWNTSNGLPNLSAGFTETDGGTCGTNQACTFWRGPIITVGGSMIVGSGPVSMWVRGD